MQYSDHVTLYQQHWKKKTYIHAKNIPCGFDCHYMRVLIKYFECDRAVVFSCSIQNIQNLNLSIQNVKLFILRQAQIVSKSEVWQLPSPFLWKFSLISSFALSFCKIKVVCIIIQILYIDLVTSIMQKKREKTIQ